MIEKCSVCGEENDSSILYCKKCVSPINVQKISDYTEEDKEYILSLLLEAVAKKKKEVVKNRKKLIDSPFFDEYLNVYWLRPGTLILSQRKYWKP